MARLSYNLARMIKNQRSRGLVLNLLVVITIPSGLVFIAVAITSGLLNNLSIALVSLAVFLMAIPIALYIKVKLHGKFEGPLRQSISSNLHDHGLLVLVVQDDYAERLPSLMVRQGLFTKRCRPPGSMQERLDSLAVAYQEVCRDAGLAAYPDGYYRMLRGLQIAGLVTLLIGLSLQCLIYDIGQIGLYSGISIGLFFILAGIFNALVLLIRQAVSAELISAKELKD